MIHFVDIIVSYEVERFIRIEIKSQWVIYCVISFECPVDKFRDIEYLNERDKRA